MRGGLHREDEILSGRRQGCSGEALRSPREQGSVPVGGNSSGSPGRRTTPTDTGTPTPPASPYRRHPPVRERRQLWTDLRGRNPPPTPVPRSAPDPVSRASLRPASDSALSVRRESTYAPGMTDVQETYRVVSSGFGAAVNAVTPDQWGAQSPCEQWTARDLLKHVVENHRGVIASVRGGDPNLWGLKRTRSRPGATPPVPSARSREIRRRRPRRWTGRRARCLRVRSSVSS